MSANTSKAVEGRKLFFGLFIFPLLIAVGMAVLLCSAVLLTTEQETPESLIAAIKTGAPGKRWQKAFELSNELNRGGRNLRSAATVKEIAGILLDAGRYDAKTRSYMAIALGRCPGPGSVAALRSALRDSQEEVRLHALWALGGLKAEEAAEDVSALLGSDSADLRKTAAYTIGALGDKRRASELKVLLEDPAADVRWNAALALARLGDDAGFGILTGMMRRQHLASELGLSEQAIEAVMINASKGLALIQKPESIKILESVSREDKNMRVRQAAIDAIAYIHSDYGSGK